MTSYPRRFPVDNAWRSFPAVIAILLPATLVAQDRSRPIALSEALATGRISAQFSGSGVDEVRMHVALLHGSEFELMVPAGLVLVSADTKTQPVVTRMTVFFEVTKKSETSTIGTDPIVPVCLTKLEGRVPLRDPLSIQPQENAEVSAVLRIVDKYLARTPIAQAAVWITATDATWADLGRLHTSANVVGNGFYATIQPAHVAAALMFMDLAKIDYAKRRVWKEAKHICELAIQSKTPEEMADDLKAEADNWCRTRIF